MFTNGLYHWVEQIEDSDVEAPRVISDITLGNDNQKLIVVNQVPGNDS